MAGNDRHRSRGGGAGKAGRGGRHVVVVESPAKARSITGISARATGITAFRGAADPVESPDPSRYAVFRNRILQPGLEPYVATGDN